ncbi:Asp-tRNA(Asn)/Glu-tRNA(Gln) amidotransferase subunit GatA [Candidatus Pacearchaeota archaeon]|nr:Asp-tRNA(Asn)/Glu-tRNA(Gln) amidotransferase subunit GatA [Candidatus Pacearchaeota archaeon]
MKISGLSISDLHNQLVYKKRTCENLVLFYLDNIKKYNKEFNVFLDITTDYALEKAKKVDEKVARGEEIGILEGILFSIKASIATNVGKTTAGSNILKNFQSPYSSTVFEKLEKAGAILIGKTNCDSFGHGSATLNSDFGPTKNPFNPEYTAGGSSGGAAASVALSMCSFAIGEDTGGSIRQPASFCALYGLKPTYGRVSRYGSIAYGSSLDCIGPIAKSKEDIHKILNAIEGRDEKDMTTHEITKSDDKIEGITKIAIIKEFLQEGLSEDIKKVFLDKVKELKGRGYEVEEISIPSVKYAVASYYIIATTETASNLARFDGVKFGERCENPKDLEDMYVKTREENLSFETKKRIILGVYSSSAGYSDKYYKKAQIARGIIKKDIEKVLEKYDIIFSPTSPILPLTVKNTEKIDPLSVYLADIYTGVFSLAGLPVLNIPIGSVKNIPVGAQITASHLNDEILLEDLI